MTKTRQKPEAKEEKYIQWNCLLTSRDVSCVDFLAQTGHHSINSDAIRRAVAEQASRDIAEKSLRVYGALAPKNGHESDLDVREYFRGHGKRREPNPELVRKSFRLSHGDFANLDCIVRSHGLRKRSEAVRFAIRAQAAVEGFDRKT